MPAYRFEALQADGKPRKGVIEADSLKTARTQVRAQALVPLLVEAIASGSAAADRALPPRQASRRFMRRARGNGLYNQGHQRLRAQLGAG